MTQMQEFSYTTSKYNEELSLSASNTSVMQNNVFSISQYKSSTANMPNSTGKVAATGREDNNIVVSNSEGAPMDGPTREEIDAKMAAVEARTETRFVELSGKIDRVIDALGRANTDLVRVSGEIRTELQTVKSDNKYTRTTIIVTIIASIIAGLAALWVTQSNMLASFEAGITLHEASSPTPSTSAPKSPTPSPTR